MIIKRGKEKILAAIDEPVEIFPHQFAQGNHLRGQWH
jgi:hypothetical protein